MAQRRQDHIVTIGDYNVSSQDLPKGPYYCICGAVHPAKYSRDRHVAGDIKSKQSPCATGPSVPAENARWRGIGVHRASFPSHLSHCVNASCKKHFHCFLLGVFNECNVNDTLCVLVFAQETAQPASLDVDEGPSSKRHRPDALKDVIVNAGLARKALMDDAPQLSSLGLNERVMVLKHLGQQASRDDEYFSLPMAARALQDAGSDLQSLELVSAPPGPLFPGDSLFGASNQASAARGYLESHPWRGTKRGCPRWTLFVVPNRIYMYDEFKVQSYSILSGGTSKKVPDIITQHVKQCLES